ncbi:MAG TPA: hypothetical protein VFS43_09290 [Polyangiaceae bacterium]|nr:hypothetical protein [Polyangiaceae bacterium]
MRRTTTPRLAALAPAAAVVALGLFAARPAAAQSIIKSPGDHPDAWELEPHLNIRPFDTPDRDVGLGLGFRARVPIVENGFVPSINNSVGIGFGIDWLNYRACRRGDCGSVNHFIIPVVMQWNFWLTRSWSVFGEPGLSLNFYSDRGDYCEDRFGNRYGRCYRDRDVDLVLFAGARWHFSQYTTLTMRVGWPYWSVGVSFL